MSNCMCENFKDCERFHKLLSMNDGKAALKYLKIRKISPEIISKFKIGWCPVDDPKIHLRGRITVPLKNMYGEILAFAGRIPTYNNGGDVCSLYNNKIIEYIKDGKKVRNEIKWWHESFPKRNYLYGLSETWKNIYEKNVVVIVEGECDFWACYQNGIKNIVALLGTNFTLFHIRKLLSLCENIILMMDGDDAGNSSWNKSLEKYNELKEVSFNYFNLDRIQLPDGHDPSSFISEFGIDSIIDSYEKILKDYNERPPF